MTRDEAVAIARDYLWQAQERMADVYPDRQFLPQVAITEGSLVNTLAALGVLKIEEPNKTATAELADILHRVDIPDQKLDVRAKIIELCLDERGFQIVRKP